MHLLKQLIRHCVMCWYQCNISPIRPEMIQTHPNTQGKNVRDAKAPNKKMIKIKPVEAGENAVIQKMLNPRDKDIEEEEA